MSLGVGTRPHIFIWIFKICFDFDILGLFVYWKLYEMPHPRSEFDLMYLREFINFSNHLKIEYVFMFFFSFLV
jgi:hypothetical protein